MELLVFRLAPTLLKSLLFSGEVYIRRHSTLVDELQFLQ